MLRLATRPASLAAQALQRRAASGSGNSSRSLALPSLFDSFFNEPFFGSSLIQPQPPSFCNVDVAENKGGYVISADTPGMKVGEVKIKVDRNNVLTLSGERKNEVETNEDNFHRVERSFGKFSRSFRLPANINRKDIQAEMKDGVLKVTIPKLNAEETEDVVDVQVKGSE
eukprot:m.50490 g.50490  ORF g.50490 m.50490 type:complete len:170 (-) comp15143_c0_seq2:46-555(-)